MKKIVIGVVLVILLGVGGYFGYTEYTSEMKIAGEIYQYLNAYEMTMLNKLTGYDVVVSSIIAPAMGIDSKDVKVAIGDNNELLNVKYKFASYSEK